MKDNEIRWEDMVMGMDIEAILMNEYHSESNTCTNYDSTSGDVDEAYRDAFKEFSTLPKVVKK
jgi:hypothetical protein